MSLRTVGAGGIFIIVLIAFTVQTELAQYVQQTLEYRKPYTLLYLTHSGYAIILPIHLFVMKLMGIQIEPALSTLRGILRHQFASEVDLPNSTLQPPSSRMRRLIDTNLRRQGRKEWKFRLGLTVLKLTFLIAIPSLTWYSAVPLTSMTDITAIYNIFAFWAYLLSIRFLNEKATTFKLSAVLVAVAGVFIIAYGDSFLVEPIEKTTLGNDRFLGNVLALVGSISYAWYEVWYKMNVSLPAPPTSEDLERDPGESDSLLSSSRSSINNDSESTIKGLTRTAINSPVPTIRASSPTPIDPSTNFKNDAATSVSSFLPPPIPPSNITFLLHSNLFTSLIGLFTLLLLWIPIPILHFTSLEPFVFPPTPTLLPILGVILAGVIFNSGFMILLSLWGPVIASVGNLCTLVLVAVVDMLVGGVSLSRWTMGGSGLVVMAFGMLVWEAGSKGQNVEVGETS